jgi:hypothetical protein
LSGLSAQRIAARQSLSRREFLHDAVGATAASRLFSLAPFAQAQNLGRTPRPKAVVVTFGGGARDSETFGPQGQANIPHLLSELVPQGTFYTQVINRGILGHYVATASLATGVYERFNNFSSTRPANPTVFEYMRRELHRPADDTWVVAPSNGFGGIGESTHSAYGVGMGARVLLPKHLLAAAVAEHGAASVEHLLRDNYETPMFDPSPTGLLPPEQAARLASMLRFSLSDFRQHALDLSSPDELSVFIARRIMRELAPSLLWLTLHDIDIAHAGAFSLYLEGIQRSDRLCAEIWRGIQSEPEYKDRTTLYILPDFGRDYDEDAGGNGFQHHRTGDALSRTTWMLVLGPGVRQNTVVDRPVESIDLVPTLASRLGFQAPFAHGRPLQEVLS